MPAAKKEKEVLETKPSDEVIEIYTHDVQHVFNKVKSSPRGLSQKEVVFCCLAACK